MRRLPRPPSSLWVGVAILVVVALLFTWAILEEVRLDEEISRASVDDEVEDLSRCLPVFLDAALQGARPGPERTPVTWAEPLVQRAAAHQLEIRRVTVRDEAGGVLFDGRAGSPPAGDEVRRELGLPTAGRRAEVLLRVTPIVGSESELVEERSRILDWIGWGGGVLALLGGSVIGLSWSGIRRARRAVEAAYLRDERILEALGPALLVVECGGRIIEANQAARRVVGEDAASSIPGLSLDAAANLPAPARAAVRAVAAGSGAVAVRAAEPVEHGGRTWAFHVASLGSDPGEALLVLEDVTERKQLERTLAERKRLADIGELAASIAHALRNPLAAIKTYAQLLPRRFEEAAFRAEFLEVVTAEAARLDRILAQVLDYTKPLQPRPERIDLRDVVRGVVAAQRPGAEERGVTLAEEEAGDRLPAPLEVSADAELLRQAIENILVNACDAAAHAPPGRRHVSVRACARDGMVEVRVEDRGSGMSLHQLERAFVPFATTKQDGTGLGLPYARRIALVHGGTLELASRQSEGTVASIAVPRFAAASAAGGTGGTA